MGIPTLLVALAAAGFPSADGVSMRAPGGWSAWHGSDRVERVTVLPGSVNTSFRERGRAFYVFVRRPTPAMARALDTLRIEPR